MGKNFSCNNVGQRRKGDFYQTPFSLTEQFLNKEVFDINKSILEPCCGKNAIVKVLKKFAFQKITSYDISKGIDFLEEKRKFNYIITNPPYSLAFEFIIKAREIVKDKFAFLLPLAYLHGKKRFDLIYSDPYFKLKKVYVFTRYPLLSEKIRKDGKYNTGMMVYAWFVFDKMYIGKPMIDWIDNNDFVVKGDD